LLCALSYAKHNCKGKLFMSLSFFLPPIAHVPWLLQVVRALNALYTIRERGGPFTTGNSVPSRNKASLQKGRHKYSLWAHREQTGTTAAVYALLGGTTVVACHTVGHHSQQMCNCSRDALHVTVRSP
jgi:hypothetical protein